MTLKEMFNQYMQMRSPLGPSGVTGRIHWTIMQRLAEEPHSVDVRAVIEEIAPDFFTNNSRSSVAQLIGNRKSAVEKSLAGMVSAYDFPWRSIRLHPTQGSSIISLQVKEEARERLDPPGEEEKIKFPWEVQQALRIVRDYARSKGHEEAVDTLVSRLSQSST